MSAPLVDRLVQQLQAKGMGAADARTTAVQLLQDRGHVDASGELTAAGRARQAMGSDGRAKDRAAGASEGRHKAADYAYDQGTNRATLKPGARR